MLWCVKIRRWRLERYMWDPAWRGRMITGGWTSCSVWHCVVLFLLFCTVSDSLTAQSSHSYVHRFVNNITVLIFVLFIVILIHYVLSVCKDSKTFVNLQSSLHEHTFILTLHKPCVISSEAHTVPVFPMWVSLVWLSLQHNNVWFSLLSASSVLCL